ncbi:MAG: nucleotidyltransferase domain-containing protein [Thermofilaceae archaeon]
MGRRVALGGVRRVRGEYELSSLIERIKEFPETLAIILFGSYVRGAIKGTSDIDVAVIVRKPDKRVEAEIGSMYSPYFDVVLFHRLPLHIQFEVLKYGRVVFCRDEEELLEVKRRVLREYLDTAWMYERIKRKVLYEDSGSNPKV